MQSPKMMLSFALNPLTNTLQFVTVPEIPFQPTAQLTSSQSKLNHHQDLVRIQQERGTADHAKEASARRQRKLNQQNELDYRLSSLIISIHEGFSWVEHQVDQILEIGPKTPVELLMMMDYTQKLSYIRSKCKTLPCLAEKLSMEINRVIEWVLSEQEEYCKQLCSRFLPDPDQ